MPPAPHPDSDWAAMAPSSGEEEGALEPLPKRRAKATAKSIVRRGDTEGEVWGKHFRFVKAKRDGSEIAWTATCHFHRHDGRCNQWITFTEVGSRDEAKRRLKEWCIRGMLIPDAPGAKAIHMKDKSKKYPISHVRSDEALDQIANHIT